MPQLGGRLHGPPFDDPPEVLVLGHLVTHPERLRGHPAVAVLGERVGGQPRPQHHPVGTGIPRGHPQLEGVVEKARLGQRPVARQGAGAQKNCRRAHAAYPDELAAADPPPPVALDAHRYILFASHRTLLP